MSSALEKLTKWRSVFTGWQLGTRKDSDPESQAVRDHREVTMIMRAELSALVGLLAEKGHFTVEEYQARLDFEAEYLDKIYEKKFPGFVTTETGVTMTMPDVLKTTAGWRP